MLINKIIVFHVKNNFFCNKNHVNHAMLLVKNVLENQMIIVKNAKRIWFFIKESVYNSVQTKLLISKAYVVMKIA